MIGLKIMKINYVLGLNFLHSDTSACIFKNGELIAAAEEERFTRIKHTSDFPVNAVNFCLNEANIDISDLDVITLNSNPLSAIEKKIFYTLKNLKAYILAFKSLTNIKKKISIKNLIKENFGNQKKFQGKIRYIDHHISHIASSSCFSGFDESVNLSIDGFGDFASAAWGTFSNNKISIDNKIYFPHSMGIFYQSITQFLGFKNYGDEYKVMGLSSYGKPVYEAELSKLLFNTKKGYELNLKYFVHQDKKIIKDDQSGQINYIDLYSNSLFELIGKDRKKDEKITQRHMDIAKSAQVVYEKTLFTLLNILYEKYKIKNLTLSGGCAMNSVANGKILKKTSFDKIYISPNPGDAGGSVGSALQFLLKNKSKIEKNINYAYLGKNYDDEIIQREIENKNLKKNFHVEKLSNENLLNFVTEQLCLSKVVGWFQGKMEWGARALGNRSILADARNPKIKDIINSKIKRRESFRPFAPAILREFTDDWFEINKDVPYMSEVYKILEKHIKKLPGITHIDGTGRLQTVSELNNLKFYNLINTFYKKTNIPLILNTSFNENEPIVESPEQAINCFLRTEMDMLVLENWIILRK